MHFEFLAQVVHVILDRRSFDAEPAGDLLVREPAIDQMCDLQLAPRQRHGGGVAVVGADGLLARLRQRGHAAVQRRSSSR